MLFEVKFLFALSRTYRKPLKAFVKSPAIFFSGNSPNWPTEIQQLYFFFYRASFYNKWTKKEYVVLRGSIHVRSS